MATASNGTYAEDATVPTSAGSGNAGSGFANNTSTQSSTGPEEVGWYFVQQYYTTLNKTPERLHLFYNRKSSFVFGNEGDNIAMSQGRTEISEKIKSLDFKDCKVLVTNVDSLASINGGIVVQVLGQMTNNSEPNRRFSQTFFLAEQPSGYYVLNDIFRYLKEDDEDEEEELVPVDQHEDGIQEPSAVVDKEESVEKTPELVEPKAEEPITKEQEQPVEEAKVDVSDVPEVDTKDEEKPAEEEKVEEKEAAEPEKQEAESTPSSAAPAAIPPPAVPTMPTPASKTEESSAPASKSPSPSPTPASEESKPVSTPSTTTTSAPSTAPSAPPAKRTWANLLAPSGAKPATSTSTATATTATPATTVTNSTQSKETTAPPAAPRPTTPNTPNTPSSTGGWQTTGESRRQSRPVSMSGPPEGQTQAYVKHVTERVNPAQLKEALAKFGTIKHFEIVKARSCAFVDFAEPSQFLAAVGANPHRIGDQTVFVEERKQRTGGAPFANGGGRGGRGGFQGERSGSGRGGFQRQGERQGSGRGGSFPRGGGSSAPRGGAPPS